MEKVSSTSTQATSVSSNPTSDNEALDVERIASNNRKRSRVWNHFTRETQPDSTEKAICNYCKQPLVCLGNSGTNHLHRHLKFACKSNPHKDMRRMLVAKSPNFKFEQEVSRNCLARLLICTELPFKIVEHPSFVAFMKSLQPLFNMVGRHTIRTDCFAIYKEEKKKLYSFLKDLDSRVSFTMDLWTSNQKLGYLVLTAHYINDEFVLNKKIMNFKKVPYPRTSYALNDVLENCLTEWDLDAKLCTLTVDNCTTNDALIRHFKRDFGEKLLFNGEHIHIRCCAHILNIMVQDGIKVMDESIKHIRSLITYVVSSPSRMQVFNGMAQFFKLPTKKGLILDVPTRWNSTYVMLHNALSYKDVFIKYADEHYSGLDVPTLDDWRKAELVTNFLKTFVDTTEVFSGSKYPTSNLYFREIWTIRGLLEDEIANGDEIIKTLALEMRKKYKKYWEHCNKILLIASILDPRSKLAYIEYTYLKAFGNEMSKKKIEELQDFLNEVYAQYLKAAQRQESVVDVSSGGTSGRSTYVGLGKRRADLEFAEFWSQNAMKRAKRNEVDSYLEENLLPPMSDTEFNILDWWKTNATQYPVLSKLARDILAIPVSTVSSEAAFSTGGRVVDQYRSRLNPYTIEALICTQDWLRHEYYIDENEVSSSFNSYILDEGLYECLAE